MKGKYKVYPEYKESGDKWIKEIPTNWKILRTKQMFSLTKTLVGERSNEYQLLSLTLQGVIPRDISSGEGKIPADFGTYQEVNENNLIFCLFDIDETPRTIGISPDAGMITGAYNVYKCSNCCNPKYAYYYFLHIDSFKGLRPFYTGLRKVVRAETFSNIRMPNPSLIEQTQIANFLDHETAKIDNLIEKQKRLIELLKEKRQAVISHAVTKGLNPDAPMRDSGVEWLGEIPEGWEVKKSFYIFSSSPRNGVSPPITESKDSIPTFSISALRDGIVDIGNNMKWTTLLEEDIEKYKVFEGDILLVRGNGNLSMVGQAGIVEGLVPEKCIYPDILIKVGMEQSEMRKDYFIFTWNSFYVREQIEKKANTTNGTYKVAGSDVRNILILCPPLVEQDQIVDYIRLNTSKYNDLISSAENLHALLQERRTALISSVVTGKIDVRDWVEPKRSCKWTRYKKE